MLGATHIAKIAKKNNDRYSIHAGQFISTYTEIEEETGLGRAKIQRLLKVLVELNMITIEPHPRATIFTIVNYNAYQDYISSNDKKSDTQNDTLAKPVSASPGNQKNSNVDTESDTQDTQIYIAKMERDSKYRIFESVWSQYPRKEGKKQAYKTFLKTVKNNQDTENIFLALNNYNIYINNKYPDGSLEFVQKGSTWMGCWEDWIDNKLLDGLKRKTKQKRGFKERWAFLQPEEEIYEPSKKPRSIDEIIGISL